MIFLGFFENIYFFLLPFGFENEVKSLLYFENSLFACPLPVFVLRGIVPYPQLAAACSCSHALIRFTATEEHKAGQAS